VKNNLPSLSVLTVLGHWEATPESSVRALQVLRKRWPGADVVFSGGDAVSAGAYSLEDAPLVAQAVLALDPTVHLAFQHVHYLTPKSLYHRNTMFLPHKSFDSNHRPLHSGYIGSWQRPTPVGALADQLRLLARLHEIFQIQATFVFLGGGKTAAAELVALHKTNHRGLVKGCQLVILTGIPSKARASDLSLVEQEAMVLAAEENSEWTCYRESEHGLIIFVHN